MRYTDVDPIGIDVRHAFARVRTRTRRCSTVEPDPTQQSNPFVIQPITTSAIHDCKLSPRRYRALSVPFRIGTGIIFTITSTEGAALSNALLDMAFVLTIAYVGVLPLTSVIGLPRIGIDWDPTNYGLGTWLLLLIVALWYAAVFVIPLAFFAFILALPTG